MWEKVLGKRTRSLGGAIHGQVKRGLNVGNLVHIKISPWALGSLPHAWQD